MQYILKLVHNSEFKTLKCKLYNDSVMKKDPMGKGLRICYVISDIKKGLWNGVVYESYCWMEAGMWNWRTEPLGRCICRGL